MTNRNGTHEPSFYVSLAEAASSNRDWAVAAGHYLNAAELAPEGERVALVQAGQACILKATDADNGVVTIPAHYTPPPKLGQDRARVMKLARSGELPEEAGIVLSWFYGVVAEDIGSFFQGLCRCFSSADAHNRAALRRGFPVFDDWWEEFNCEDSGLKWLADHWTPNPEKRRAVKVLARGDSPMVMLPADTYHGEGMMREARVTALVPMKDGGTLVYYERPARPPGAHRDGPSVFFGLPIAAVCMVLGVEP